MAHILPIKNDKSSFYNSYRISVGVSVPKDLANR